MFKNRKYFKGGDVFCKVVTGKYANGEGTGIKVDDCKTGENLAKSDQEKATQEKAQTSNSPTADNKQAEQTVKAEQATDVTATAAASGQSANLQQTTDKNNSDTLAPAPTNNSDGGGYRKTSEKAVIKNNKMRIVYLGPRGCKYVKVDGSFVPLKSVIAPKMKLSHHFSEFSLF